MHNKEDLLGILFEAMEVLSEVESREDALDMLETAQCAYVKLNVFLLAYDRDILAGTPGYMGFKEHYDKDTDASVTSVEDTDEK